MTSPTSPLSSLDATVVSTLFSPPTTQLDLSDDEKRVMTWLSSRLLDTNNQHDLALSQLYYEGMNTIPSLGISVPPELEALRAVLGWCAAGIDARSERLTLQGFRMPGKTTVDEDLQTAWQFNNLDFESTLVHNDAMIYRHSFAVLGVTGNPGEPPLTTIESPKNMTASWDVRRREVSASYQTYYDVDPASETFRNQLATLYTRDAVIQLVSGPRGWEVQERNDHNMGFVPVIMFANKPTASNRYGCSEIGASWRNCQDRAARALVRNEVAAEFFAAMKVWLLGMNEQAFKKPDGSVATALETFTGRVSTLDADKHGNLPNVIIQQSQDPTGMIKFIDHERQVMSSNGIPLDYLGMVSDGNPTSSDAITKGDFRLFKRSFRLLTQFGNGWEDWARMTLRIWQGRVPDGGEQIESDWIKPTIPTPNADTVTVTTQINAGMIAPDDDDALAEVGWSPVQRTRIAANLKRHKGLAKLDQALDGLKPPESTSTPQQPLDAEQPGALMALQQARDAATA